MLWSLAVLAVIASVQGRAVNISNTWVLPEEGFPVFYRYFRDRISWYEADAVCQFHHANLVTVDTTAQYDALRAYLKELDISSAVWVGLIRSNPDGDFTWTDYRGLSGDGYWSSAPDTRSAPLCAAADPTADYRWEARACGGPTVASFICELPVPQWASGSEGCMVRELPALTVLYLPESAAVQLTADCGLAGVKRVQCTGGVKREELLNNLTCAEPPEDLTTSLTSEATITTASSETVTDLYVSQEVSNAEIMSTEREDVTLPVLVHHTPIPIPNEIKGQNILNRISVSKNIHFNMVNDNNLESNDIPENAHQNENDLSEEEANRLEDERHMQHKILHNEYARLGNIGNFENIFSQPADHFVPPLVMAKARISDDMTVLSLEEKQAQQLSEQRKFQHRNYQQFNFKAESYTKEPITTDKATITEKPLIMTTPAFKTKDTKKIISTKKYNEKYTDPKSKNTKTIEKPIRILEKVTTQAPTFLKTVQLQKSIISNKQKSVEEEEDPSIDLSVILKERTNNQSVAKTTNPPTSVNTTHFIKEDITDKVTITTAEDSVTEINEPVQGMTHEVIQITILDKDRTSAIPTVFEITTKVPTTEKSSKINNLVGTTTKVNEIPTETSTSRSTNTDDVISKELKTLKIAKNGPNSTITQQENISISTQSFVETHSTKQTFVASPSTLSSLGQELEDTTITISNPTVNNTTSSNATTANVKSVSITTQSPTENTEKHTNATEATEDIDDKLEEIRDDGYDTSTLLGETIDDMDSPLLSAANEPLHRPTRSRRPQQPPNRKFNPFRILG